MFRFLGVTAVIHYFMKKILFLFIMFVLPLSAAAQVKFGYLSYSEAVKAMPEYAVMQKNLESLKAQYEDETKRSEEEFNEKYQLFLEGRKELADPILKKRQSELQELLAKGISFKAEAARLLKQAEADMYAPLKTKLADELRRMIGCDKTELIAVETDPECFEYPALEFMQAKSREEDCLFYYFHTKGVSYYGGDLSDRNFRRLRRNVDAWRRMMEYFLFTEWRVAVNTLQGGYDTTTCAACRRSPKNA